MKLKLHQRNAVKKFMKEDGYMFVHGTGTGKTLSAVTASQCFLSQYKKRKVIFVGPTSLLKNFEKELMNYGISKQDINSKYEFYSFDRVMSLHKKGQPIDCKKNMLIIDEAHNLRNRKEAVRKRGAKDKEESKRYQAVMNCAKNAEKRLLLTATPIVNSIGDMFALINILYGKNLVGTRQEVNKGMAEFAVGVVPNKENFEKLYKLLKGRVDYFTDVLNSNFPLTKHYYEEVVMPDNYKKMCMRYMEKDSDLEYIFNNPKSFYNAQRRIVNKVKDNYFSKKLQKMKEVIKQGKTLIYTNWLDFGVQPIKKTLDSMKASYGIFSGKLKKDARQNLVDQFNNNEIDAMVITSAGSEGLDLKGTKNVIILDPVWNPAGVNQIIGRAIRFKSHEHLPKYQRKVHIYKMIMVTRANVPWNRDTFSGDAILYQIIEGKMALTKEINNLFEKINKSKTTYNGKFSFDSSEVDMLNEAIENEQVLDEDTQSKQSRVFSANSKKRSKDKIHIYGRDSCPFCIKAKQLCDEKKQLYKFNDVEKKANLRKDFEEKLRVAISEMNAKEKKRKGIENDEYPYVPAIFNKNYKFIGGYGELEKYLK